jgi:hypothetical protein
MSTVCWSICFITRPTTGVHLDVEVAKHIRVARVGDRRAPPFVLVEAKEHVLNPVGEVEHASTTAPRRVLLRASKNIVSRSW